MMQHPHPCVSLPTVLASPPLVLPSSASQQATGILLPLPAAVMQHRNKTFSQVANVDGVQPRAVRKLRHLGNRHVGKA